MNKALIFLAGAILAASSLAADGDYKVHDGNKIFYSVFNSSFIQPDTAAAHDIIRGKNRALVNIAVVPVNRQSGGIPALIKGSAANLLQQTQKLDFFEVREGEVVYYLAAFKFDDQDPLTFKIDIRADPNKPSHRIQFQKTLYRD